VLKGQLDRAIKDYQQVVAMEPNEVRYRQRLAELLVRDRRKEEAIAQYEDIGKHYAENSYFLKAIAIYKQIQRLSPGNNATSLTIASLNHQQGLIGNALAEYGQVVAQLEKEGAQKEALKVVEKMLGVDAEHVATRLKHAELLFATGAADDSRQAFTTLLSSLQARGHAADADAEAVSARMRELFPGEPASAAAVAKPADGSLAPGGFGAAEDVPGVADTLSAPWETDVPTPPENVVGEAQGDMELPDAFSHPFAGEQAPAAVTDLPDPFAAPPEPETAGHPAAAAAAPGSAWEEEIELDLDDDFALEFTSAPDVGNAAIAAVPEPVAFQPSAPETVDESQTGVDLHLDFSLELDFDEVAHSLDEEPLDEEPHAAVELDPEQESSLELGLPQDLPGAFTETPWSEEGVEPEEFEEPEEPEEPEELEEHLEAPEPEEHLEGVELEEPEATLESAEPEAALPWASEEEGEVRAVRGWEEIYPGCDELPGVELDIEELESHYDLGIGYKEMGMYGGAIKEFDVAARNPQRRVGCLTLQAICYREKGESEKAEELLRSGLSLDVLSSEERVCLEYELAVLLEGSGDVEEAISLYREVSRANPGYHDVSRRLSALSGEEPLDIIDLELEE